MSSPKSVVSIATVRPRPEHGSVRRFAAVLLALMLTLPSGAGFAAAEGKIAGTVRLEGHAKSGVVVAFIELQSGEVIRATTGEDGAFEAHAPVGEYTVTTESLAGLAVRTAPVRVSVVEGKVASADIELAGIPAAVLDEPPSAPAPSEPGATPPAALAQAPAEAQPAADGQVAPGARPEGPAALPGTFAETTGAGATIQFAPVTCFIAGEFPLLDAQIEPVASVARARVYFRSAKGTFFYYVEMSENTGRYEGKLPRPYVEASPITYYLESTTTEFEESQTREIEAIVVKDRAECGDRTVAAAGPAGPVTVFSASTGTLSTPSGFAAAAASSLAVAAITVIAAGAAAAGVVGGVVVGPGTAATPPPINASPSAIPTPVPLPQPTATPITLFR